MKLTSKKPSNPYHAAVHHAGKATKAILHHSRKMPHHFRVVKKHLSRGIPTHAQALQWLEDSFGVAEFEVGPEAVLI